MSKAKYEIARPILTISEFEQSSSFWFKWRGKTVHRSVLMSLQYRVLKNSIEHGMIHEARLKEV